MYDIVNIIDKGRVIAIWSPIHRQGGTSALTALLASYISEVEKEEDNKMLLMSNELYGAPTATKYITSEQLPTSLAEVVYLSKTESLKSYEDIYNNSSSNIKNLDILQSVKRSQQVKQFLAQNIKNILEVAKTGYKYIFVDTVSGTMDATTSEILKNSDVVIVCMPQDKFIWDNWLRKLDGTFHKALENKRYMLVSGLHYEYKYMSYVKMAKELKDEELAWLSQNELVKASAETRSMLEMVRTELKKKSEKQDDCIREIRIIYDMVLKNIELVRQEELKLEEEEKAKDELENNKRISSLLDMFNESYYEENNFNDTDEQSTQTSLTGDIQSDAQSKNTDSNHSKSDTQNIKQKQKRQIKTHNFLGGLFGNKDDNLLGQPNKDIIKLKDKDTKSFEKKASKQDHSIDTMNEPDGSDDLIDELGLSNTLMNSQTSKNDLSDLVDDDDF